MGDAAVGKTSLLDRYVEGIFDENEKATLGSEYKTKEITVKGQKIKLLLFDTAGIPPLPGKLTEKVKKDSEP